LEESVDVKLRISKHIIKVIIQTLLAKNRQAQHLPFYLVIGLIDKVIKARQIQNIPDTSSSYDLRGLFQLCNYSQILRRPQGQIFKDSFSITGNNSLKIHILFSIDKK